MEAAHVVDLASLRSLPVVADAAEVARWEEGGLRERLLSGAWRPDLERRLGYELDPARRKAWGAACIALCAFRSFVRQIAVQADQEPIITCDGATDDQLEQVMRWRPLRLHAQLARMVVGVREYAMAVGWDAQRGEPTIGLQSTRILLRADPRRPTVPVRWAEPVARQRLHYSAEWLWLTWDISDPAQPRWLIECDRGHGLIDVTADYATEEERAWAAAYPWIADGQPYIPRVLYHAIEPAGLWDWSEGQEGVDATLSIGVAWTEWLHILRDASWAQKYAINLRPAGKVPQPGGEAATIPVDQASILMLRSDDQSGQMGVLGVAADPESFGRAIRDFMAVTAESFGLAASDIEQTSSGSSGVSISLRRDAIRRLQRPIATSMARADEELLAKLGALATAHGHPMPTTGWHVEYPAVEATREELQARTLEQTSTLAAGLTSRVEIVMRRDRVDRQEAIARLLQWAADEAQLQRARAELLASTEPVDEESKDGDD